MTIEQVDPLIHDEILLALDQPEDTDPLLVPQKPGKQTTQKKAQLLMLDPEPLRSEGECPGGKYWYIEDVDQAVALLEKWAADGRWAAVDIENGAAWRYERNSEEKRVVELVDPFLCPLFLCSVSTCPGEAVVFEMRELMEDERFNAAFRCFLGNCKLVAHNSLHEMTFFLARFGEPGNFCYDTMLVNQLMNAGLPSCSGLDDMMKKHFDVDTDKTWQKFFLKLDPNSPLPNEAIAYSAGDVCRLLELAALVDRKLAESGLEHVWKELELPFTVWLAKSRVHGVTTDPQILEEGRVKVQAAKEKIAARIAELAPEIKNLGSWQQVMAWFDSRGIDLESTDEPHLEEAKEQTTDPVIREVIEQLLAYRGRHKLLSTYIEPLLWEHPSPYDGRVRTTWTQLDTDTGRMSSKKPNLQNIPSKGEDVWIRGAIVAQPGHTLFFIDLSQMEVRILAEMAGEQKMIDAFNYLEVLKQELIDYAHQHHLPPDIEALAEKDPEKLSQITAAHPKVGELLKQLADRDFHRTTASILFGIPPEKITKDQRSRAKTISFALPYGASPKGVAEQAGIPFEEAKQLVNDYYKRFPKVARFLELLRIKASKGVSETFAGRRRHYLLPSLQKKLKSVQAASEGNPKNWKKITKKWHSDDVTEIANKMYRSELGAIERAGTNAPIQGGNGDILKLATILLGPQLEALHPEAAILMFVHDEIVGTAPTELVQEAARLGREAMLKAAQRWMKKTPADVSCTIAERWGK